MAEIRKNGKWMADGKELDFSGVRKLSDDAGECRRRHHESIQNPIGTEMSIWSAAVAAAKAGRSSARRNQMSFRFAAISAEEFRGKNRYPDPGPKCFIKKHG